MFFVGQCILRQDFTDQREIWHEVPPVSQTGLLKFWQS